MPHVFNMVALNGKLWSNNFVAFNLSDALSGHNEFGTNPPRNFSCNFGTFSSNHASYIKIKIVFFGTKREVFRIKIVWYNCIKKSSVVVLLLSVNIVHLSIAFIYSKGSIDSIITNTILYAHKFWNT